VAVVARFGFGTDAEEAIPVACLAGDMVGDCVALRDVMTGTGRWRVTRADPLQDVRMPAIGVLVRKDTPTTGVMQRVGQVRGIFAGLNAMRPVWVGLDGRPTQACPGSDAGPVIVQRFGIPVAGDVLFLTGEMGPLTKRAMLEG
jgi:hypothetical protein